MNRINSSRRSVISVGAVLKPAAQQRVQPTALSGRFSIADVY
jgi:hypothetical protein